jgi:Leucine-rich repeat (LRR) protein
LEKLYFRNNKISDISVLKNLKNLKLISVEGNFFDASALNLSII